MRGLSQISSVSMLACLGKFVTIAFRHVKQTTHTPKMVRSCSHVHFLLILLPSPIDSGSLFCWDLSLNSHFGSFKSKLVCHQYCSRKIRVCGWLWFCTTKSKQLIYRWKPYNAIVHSLSVNLCLWEMWRKGKEDKDHISDLYMVSIMSNLLLYHFQMKTNTTGRNEWNLQILYTA